MSSIGRFRPLWAGIVLAALATASGCPKPAEKPAEENSPVTRTAEAPVDRSPVVKMPGVEFQQPAVTPPSVAPPKAAAAPIAPLPPNTAVSGSAERSAGYNPLRQPEQSAAKQPPEQVQPPSDEDDRPGRKPKPGRPATSKNSATPFDPVKENGPIFEGWAKPKVALILTGMEDGYIEPCGCAGLDRMKGGMSRRHSLFNDLRQKGWPVVGLDVGGLVHDFGAQAEQKYQTVVEGKRKTGYEAITFGANDLRLPAGYLLSLAAGADGKTGMFISANVGLLGSPGEIVPQSRLIEAGGVKIGVTAVLGKQYQKDIHTSEIQFVDPEAALGKIVPELKQKADYLVLLAHADLEESIALGKRFPQFNVVVSAGGFPEPPKEPETIPGTKNLLITVGYKGQNAIVLGLFDGAEPTWRYQRVPLDSRFPQSNQMKLLMAAYQEQVKQLYLAGQLGLRPVPSPWADKSNGKYVGSAECESCHDISNDIWKHSGHAKAYGTLEKLDPPRNFDPECVSCHVIGWNPQKYFPYVGGYENKEKTPQLIDVGCEDCHGPGQNHCNAELSGSEELRQKLRKAMVITKEDEKKDQGCVACHDGDNSPDFKFDLYWPFVEHYEKE